MRLSLAILSVFYYQSAFANYNLVYQTLCRDTQYFSGASVCSSGDSIDLKIKIPPVRGQLRVMDCNKDLTNSGTPNDFNTITWRTGFWLWQRKIIQLSNTPLITIKAPQKNCPITVSVTGEETGTQNAVILNEPRDSFQDFSQLSCAGDEFKPTRQGLASCIGLSGANFKIKVSPEPLTKYIVDVVGCGYQEKLTSQTFVGQLKDRACVMDTMITYMSEKNPVIMKSRFLMVGRDRAMQELDKPIIVRDADKLRTFKPLGASIYSMEVYLNGQILWRSGPRTDETFWATEQPTNSKLCVSAYSKSGAFSGACFDSKSLVELPYEFQ